MQRTWLERSRGLLLSQNRWAMIGAVLALGLLAALVVGSLIAFLTPLLALAVVGALLLGLLMLRSPQVCLIALIGICCLLPFASLPVKIGFTPTFLDGVLGALFLVWFTRLATRRQDDFIFTPLGLPVAVFLLLALFAFAAGLGHARPTATVVRHFAELLLGIAVFFVVVNNVRRREQLRQLVAVIILAGATEASIGVVLYFLPRETTIRLLSALRIFGYPAGPGVLRFIMDDPRQPMRATATAVDPNVLGGMLVLVTALAVAQLFAERPVLPRAWLASMVGIMGLCLYLTYSRGSMVGLLAALTLLAAVRYRKLLLVMLVAGLLMWTLPLTQGYVQHFLAGLQGQDLATQMRFGEYKDAFNFIRRYPWLGVGFAGTPDIDLYVGVANVYLLIAEQMGLVGLGAFLLAVGAFFIHAGVGWWRLRHDPYLGAIVLGLTAAVAGALVGGIFDHFLFNMDFPHAVSLFWLYIGLAAAAVKM